MSPLRSPQTRPAPEAGSQVSRPHRSRRRFLGARAVSVAAALVFAAVVPWQSSISAAHAHRPAGFAPAPNSGAQQTDPAKRVAAPARVRLAVAPKRVEPGKRAVATVHVRSQGKPVSGKVRVVVRGHHHVWKRAGLASQGKVVIRLPRIKAAGLYRVRATFVGTPSVRRSRSAEKAFRVKKGHAGGRGGFPNASNTGVPAGVTLRPYTGPCTITRAGTVIAGKRVNCDVDVRARGVVIRNSLINGHIVVDTDVNRTWSLRLTDSDVAATAGDLPAVYNGNVTIIRTDIRGGHNGLECQEHSSHCVIRDSWIHDQWQAPSGDTHLGGLLVLGNQVPCTGTNGACAEIVHNTIVCDAPVNVSGGGCTGDLNLLPHWGPLPGAIVEDNYLGANTGSAYCTYGGAGMEYPATNIVYRNNVFERGTNRRCADYGPVTNFDPSAKGNVWQNNRYADGTRIKPE